MTYKQQYQGKLHLTATDRMEFCLGASSNQKVTSKEFKRGALLPCRWDTNQVSFVVLFHKCISRDILFKII